MTAMLTPHALTWLTDIHALVTAASREMVLAVLITTSAQMAATTVTPMPNVTIQLVHFSASATQATLEMGSPAVISMNAPVATHVQQTPLVQIPQVIFHVPVIPDTKATVWSEAKVANVKISTSAKAANTTVILTRHAKTQTVALTVNVTQDMKVMALLAAKLMSVKPVPIIVMQTQHASQPLAVSNEAKSDQAQNHTYVNVMKVLKATAMNAQK